MLPLFDTNQSGRTPQTTALKVLFAVMAMLIAGGIAIMFNAGFAETPVVLFFLVVAILAIVGAVGVLVSARMSTPKTKRGLEGLDLYSVIDRLVDDIDDDEAAYLQRKLDERKAKNRDDLTVSLDELLDQRAQNRRE
ncbi:MAG: hypothetical protein IT319_16015 [Anaerolineae bacterium]|nr:hypothetical protein [Anaerolineae bacterium]